MVRRRKLKRHLKHLNRSKFRRIRHITKLHRRIMARQRVGFVLLHQ
mgnify:CR=1 FL=1